MLEDLMLNATVLPVQVEYPVSESWQPEVFQVWDSFQTLENLHMHMHKRMHNEISWPWDQSRNMKFVCVLYILHTPNLKVILEYIFNNLGQETKFHGMKFSPCGTECFQFWSILYFTF